jgi:hypothetical protein
MRLSPWWRPIKRRRSNSLPLAKSRKCVNSLPVDWHPNNDKGRTPLDRAIGYTELADLLRKHGGKTGDELKAEGK